ncbi:NYN domain-containing protein [Sinomonas terrae]|uniref:NYN domain-containing protein n=1 Tax=Sinomonas terrae TaxID=2908838 RepID=A0ABS9U7W6_9MICC|nr:NYN domain-containing protein [Sinomonas terrae]MCH6472592.1 NYN domain-containing protein [Sinomonas terrae]
MKIGVYIDGYNLYYGGRGLCGRGTAGWRWLDVRALAGNVITAASGWSTPHDLHVVYCTARIKGRGNTSGQKDQDVYLRALNASGAVDVFEYGTYVERIATSPLATAGKGGRPIISQATWPLMVRDNTNGDVPGATFIASVSRREEKGSDVNVATHLLLDVLRQNVDAAVVVSNDSDLKKPIEVARDSVPVGLVNPTKNYPAGALNGDPNAGPGGHWWYQLTATDLRRAQMPASLGPKITRPNGW